jgi:hypothetical protein
MIQAARTTLFYKKASQERELRTLGICRRTEEISSSTPLHDGFLAAIDELSRAAAALLEKPYLLGVGLGGRLALFYLKIEILSPPITNSAVTRPKSSDMLGASTNFTGSAELNLNWPGSLPAGATIYKLIV